MLNKGPRGCRAGQLGGAALAGSVFAGLMLAGSPALAQGGLPQIEQSDTFISQIFWLIVTFGILYYVMDRKILPRMTGVMEERQEKIESDLAKAERLRTEAQEIYDSYQQTLQDGRGQAQKMLREANDELTREQTGRNEAFARELQQKVADAEARIAKAKEDALAEIDQAAVETAQAATAKLIGDELPKDNVEKAVKQAMGGKS